MERCLQVLVSNDTHAARPAPLVRCPALQRRHVFSSQCTQRRSLARLLSSTTQSAECMHALARHQKSGAPCLAAASADSAQPGTADHTGRYRRVMLKLSGEALQGDRGFGIDPKVLGTVARDVAAAAAEGVQIAVVVGGGNFFRGVDSAWEGLDRVSADHVGMLATCMNAVALQSALEAEGVPTRVQTAIEMRQIAEPYIRRRAMRHLERGRVVIFGAGTGNPFFSTDTAAALRAAEIGACAFLKATKVDGVFDSDPAKNAGARLQRHLEYGEVTANNLRVMDATAVVLCQENDIPVVVFNMAVPGNIARAVTGDPSVGTTIGRRAAGGQGQQQQQQTGGQHAREQQEQLALRH